MKTNLVFLFLFATSFLFSQSPNQNSGSPKAISMSGKLLESQSNQPVEYANVTIVNSQSEDIITGAMTDDQGLFIVEVPSGLTTVKIKVTYLGYRSFENILDLRRGDSSYDLGTLFLEQDDKTLDEVVVTAEQATMNLYVDRKVFNVEKDISTRGGTGEDVMRNIPGLEVDGDGNITMRNTTATIFIDGRPTTLELQNIPADQIESVEVITNPSAKFDASSAGGIINIKMKKNRKAGYNGNISAGIGTTDRYSLMSTLNISKNPWNFSLNYNYMNAGNDINTYVDRSAFTNGQLNEFFRQDNESYRYFRNNSLRATLDYNITNKDLISFTGNLSTGAWGSDENQSFRSLDANRSLISSGTQLQDNISSWNNYTAQLFYQRKINNKGKEFTADLNYNRSDRIAETNISNTIFDAQGSPITTLPLRQMIDSESFSDQITFQADYVAPTANGGRFEAGVRAFYQRTDFRNIISRFSTIQNEFVIDSALTNNFDIVENINAAYVNYVGSIAKLNYQIGVRFEQSIYEGNVLNRETSFSYAYPSADGEFFKALFPSVYLSRKLSGGQELQFNVSRKIGRPRWWQLAPRVEINDPRNLRLGNPELRPEFINLTEFNYSVKKNNWSIVSSVYGRITEDPITWITFPFEDDADVLVTTSVNGSLDYNFGWENIFKWSPGKQLDFTLSINTYYVRVTSNTPLGEFTNTGYTYDVKPMVTYRLPWGMSVQVNGSYQAPRILPQGISIPLYYMDVSLNKRIGQKWTFNLNLTDAFDSRIMGRSFETVSFIQESTMRRQARFLRFTTSYNFGKTDPKWMKNQRSRNRGNDRDGGMDMEF